MKDVASQIRQGNRLALSRLLTWIENENPEGRAAIDNLFELTGKAFIIGITGPSGSGKSTLVNRLAIQLAGGPDIPESVAVLAIDPSSPFSGGAILGDRVRMRDLMEHPEIFVRSAATRGALGGLARPASEMVLALEAGGFDFILVETVGAGQSEVDIARLAHTTLVVEAPGLGDDIQAAKAGILEIADILVVNKADKSGADAAARSLATMLEIGAESAAPNRTEWETWKVPVLKTSALNDEGIDELAAVIRQHKAYLENSGEWQRRAQTRLDDLFERLLHEKLFAEWKRNIENREYEQILGEVHSRKISPYQALRLFRA